MAVHSRIMQLEIVKQILSNQSVRNFPHLIMVGAESSAWQACSTFAAPMSARSMLRAGASCSSQGDFPNTPSRIGIANLPAGLPRCSCLAQPPHKLGLLGVWVNGVPLAVQQGRLHTVQPLT